MLNKKIIVFLQIFIIVIGIIAISHSIGIVSADHTGEHTDPSGTADEEECPDCLPGELCDECAEREANEGQELTTQERAEMDAATSNYGHQDRVEPRSTASLFPVAMGVKEILPSNSDVLEEELFQISGDWYTKKGGKYFKLDSSNAIIPKSISEAEILKLKASQRGFLGTAWYKTKAVFGNAFYAALIAGTIKLLGDTLLPEQEAAVDSVAMAVGGGYFAGTTAVDLFGASGSLGAFIGIGVGVAIFLATFKTKATQQINFMCMPWQAATGGEKCKECGKDGLPCTEYQCKSLGQACELINEGTEEQGCIWLNEGDVIAPLIQPWNDALLDNKYTYKPDSPPDRGVCIRYNNGCIPAFTPFQFGIKIAGGGVDNAPERAVCKIDTLRKDSFDEMNLFFGYSNLLKYNHTQMISLPSPEALEAENLTLENNGNFDLHVRCQDANGNANVATFVFKYCVEKGPDTTPPIIIGTNFAELDEVPIAFNQTTLGIELYANEPSDCRWAHDRDTDFGQMGENMSCSRSIFDLNAQMVYKCSTTLDGLKSRQKNDFYFRCKDKPFAKEEDRNVNSKGFKFTVAGTQPLVIDEVGPNGTVRDSTTSVKVTLAAETSAGYKEGQAACYYSDTGQADDFVKFFETDSHTHKQELYLLAGSYKYFVKCIDAGGNQDQKEINFVVEADSATPEIVRAYHENEDLTIVTSEKGACVYSLQSCSYLFADGVDMNSANGLEHFADWNTERTYYIKCEDDYGNQPLPNQCSIIVRAFEFFENTE